MASKALEGIRVLDLGRFIAAPYCGMLLADMGAEVIRVERPGGEEDRRLGLKASNGENLTFPGLARNKKGVTLDLSNRAAAREILGDLIAASDVLLHNFSPRAVRALGLGYEDARTFRQDIIYTGISCYGTDGPSAERAGFDPMAQMGSGAAALTGLEGQTPLRSGVPWVDYSTGLCAAFGTLLALRHRDNCGEGQEVDCALLQTAVSFTAPMIAEAMLLGEERPRLGNQANYLAPSDLYPCTDGHIYLTAITDNTWRALMRLVGHPQAIEDPDLATAELRFANRERVHGWIEGWSEQRSVEEALVALEDARIPCGLYRTTAQVANDPQVQARAMLEPVDLGAGIGQVPLTGIPVRLSKSPGAVVSGPPGIGEHNQEIYEGLLGYDESRMAELRARGVI